MHLDLVTPAQMEGPFYPAPGIETFQSDLTAGQGEGIPILVRGRVTDEAGGALEGAIVEIWQACASGRYRHPEDKSPRPLDPHFGYWGKCVANEWGEFQFRSVKPGAYEDNPTWTRPPHIHFKVRTPGYAELTTQMYFAGEPLNDLDEILNALAPADRRKLVVDFRDLEGISTGYFAIGLKCNRQ
jgi:protocatechuate 3,4-dioxygenase beta subunit